MNIREITGLAFLITGIVVVPFSYWLSLRWLVVAFFFICIGAPLFYTSRVMKKNKELSKYPNDNASTDNPNIPIVGSARGFRGHQFQDNGSGDSD